MTPELQRAAQLLRESKRIFVITGAGISAEAGLPTYRGVGGLYDDGLTAEGIPIEEALSGEMLKERPDITWRYVSQIESSCRGTRPSAAHLTLARLEAHREVLILTQNVDGLHHQAGSSKIIDIHGDYRNLRCMGCPHAFRVEDYAALTMPPRCEKCGAFLRPEVVLFGEMLPLPKIAQLETELRRGFDLYLSIGTSSLFPYIAAPMMQAARQGRPTIEINPERTPVSQVVALRFAQKAGEVLAAISEGL